MSEQDDVLVAEVVAGLRRRSRHTLLQRRVISILDSIEGLLARGWSVPELAAALAAEGVTQRDGRRVSAGHFGVLVARARATRRAESRLDPSAQKTLQSGLDNSRGQRSNPVTHSITQNLSVLMSKADREKQARAEQVDAQQRIDTTIDEMFGRSQASSPNAPSIVTASTSSSERGRGGRRPRRQPS